MVFVSVRAFVINFSKPRVSYVTNLIMSTGVNMSNVINLNAKVSIFLMMHKTRSCAI